MNPAIVFPIAGVVLMAWGTMCAVYNEWAARLMKKVQGIYGQRAAEMVTPGSMRFTGIVLAAGGLLFIVLGLVGFFPQQA